MISSDVTLLALHGLRITGLAEASAVAELTGADPTLIEVELKALADDDLVVRRDRSARSGWLLTPAGIDEATGLVAAELSTAGLGRSVRGAYDRFCPLNRRLLDVCCRWQVTGGPGGPVNTHHDPIYDGAIIAALGALDAEAQTLLAELAAQLERFARFGPRLAFAAAKVACGETDYFTRPVIASYHTVWFELHEDLLITLGLDRASETARLSPI
jgi:hypothetical protein